MDLRLIDSPPSPAEEAAVDGVLGPASHDDPLSVAKTRSRRTMLLPTLHALRRHIGWVSPGGLGYVCRRLGVPPAEGFGVATFYAMLPTHPRAPAFAHVCDDIVCQAAGAEKLCAALAPRLGVPETHSHRAGDSPPQ